MSKKTKEVGNLNRVKEMVAIPVELYNKLQLLQQEDNCMETASKTESDASGKMSMESDTNMSKEDNSVISDTDKNGSLIDVENRGSAKDVSSKNDYKNRAYGDVLHQLFQDYSIISGESKFLDIFKKYKSVLCTNFVSSSSFRWFKLDGSLSDEDVKILVDLHLKSVL